MSKTEKLENYNRVGLLFPSQYLAGPDLMGRDVVVVIDSIDPRHELHRADNTKERKPVVTLRGKTKKWVLNKTNAKRIAKLYGPEATGWIGKSITLYMEKVKAFGEVHDAIRVRQEKPKKPQASKGDPNEDR